MDRQESQRHKATADKPSSHISRDRAEPEAATSARAQSSEARAALDGATPAAAVDSVQLHVESPTNLQAKELRSVSGVQQIKEEAAEGTTGATEGLPHLQQIQKSFGDHDVSGVKAHVGGAAAKAAGAIGAVAYTSGDHVAFKAAPDLQTAAHEAAHVVQQRVGVQLDQGIGRSGDSYEQHADAVAARVVQGRSAQDLLDRSAPQVRSHATPTPAPPTQMLQFLGHRLDEELPEGAETPEHAGGRGETTQRRYSVEQYIAMWEEERGRKMTDAEKETLARGCIGITAVNIAAVNPPLNHCYATFDQAMAVVNEWNAFIEAHKGETLSNGHQVLEYKAFLFAKLFWSNQRAWDPSLSEEENIRLSRIPDGVTFEPDPKTGKIDMSKYYYRGQPKPIEEGGWYVNFDYGFWDEDSQCFWHANHCEPGMKVYQSTKEKFARGYTDFDKIVYCAAIGPNPNFEQAARTHV